jgi:hypothetical protein
MKLKAYLTLTEEQMKTLLAELEKARRIYKRKGVVYFCITCMRIFDPSTDKTHETHITIFSDETRDNIRNFIKGIKHLLKN